MCEPLVLPGLIESMRIRELSWSKTFLERFPGSLTASISLCYWSPGNRDSHLSHIMHGNSCFFSQLDGRRKVYSRITRQPKTNGQPLRLLGETQVDIEPAGDRNQLAQSITWIFQWAKRSIPSSVTSRINSGVRVDFQMMPSLIPLTSLSTEPERLTEVPTRLRREVLYQGSANQRHSRYKTKNPNGINFTGSLGELTDARRPLLEVHKS